uniref:DUF2505 domain-containing protein n=1 Tax=Vaginimicrobium propionicum TaxID=1871034 RepID=UPI00097148A5|nr:DUF2505 domain-containing protein [Vaginimicrobium propionicum]
MHISTRQEYAGDPKTVFDMLTNRNFLTEVAKRVGAEEYSVEAGDNETKLHAEIPSPSQVRSFVGDTLNLRFFARWTELNDGKATAALKATVDKMPASYSGEITLYGEEDKTVLNYEADFDIHIPLIGSRLEKAAAPNAVKVLDVFQQVGDEWLAD